MPKLLEPWPFWNQYHDPMPEGLPDNNILNNCGPESVAEIIGYLYNLNIPAEFIKDQMYNAGYTGYTDWTHLRGYLSSMCKLTVGLLVTDSPGILHTHLCAWLDRGWPNIVLWWADIPDKAGGHFSPCIGYDDNGSIIRANTIGGIKETLSSEQFNNAVANQNGYAALCINRTRCT